MKKRLKSKINTPNFKTLLLLLLLIILIVYLFLFISPIFQTFRMNKTEKSINITAHRCGAALAPENTILGVKNCLPFNPQRIEIDVHQTKDSVIVVLHDDSIDRTTNGKGKVKDLNYAEIEQYSVLDNNKNQVTTEKIPTLDQVIEAINGKSKLLIEIKRGNNYYPGIEKRVLETINRYNAKSWCIIQSFDLSIIKRINSLDKNIEIHKLFYGKFPYLPIWISNKLEFGSLEKLNFVSEISFFYIFATKDAIKSIHKVNKKANVWTVDDANRVKQLINLGVDGVITNHPEISK